MPALSLRRAVPEDIAFIMATERLPGYDSFIGRFSELTHHAQLRDPAFAYLVGEDEDGVPTGFVILKDLDNPAGNVCVKRIAVAKPEAGYGSLLLAGAVDFAFRDAETYRLWLDVVPGNERARKVYRKTGFSEEGIMRQCACLPSGERTDLILMSILRPEWAARHG
ncbi:GNAT family N-acetyltransferase [Peteryoungia desertarenae]|uniref:GNAT family N-acetyltransferase n=1 Tax=Peteryoungia desertarenae TaxID=1813451 RepID=A0ABX6QP50_9HYPH|nr:GNAT family protein [Peteryoungia desertarenae]QLF70037.1 GNAT family N-acetyltransferase [Peteryoungia desertarenae]